MSVRKRKWTTSKGEAKEAWIVDYVDGQGDRHIETFERKKDADDFHATVRVDIGKGIHTPASKSKTVAEAARLWVAAGEHNGLERTTLDTYRQHVDLHIVPFLGAMKLSQLTVPVARAFTDRLRTEGRSAVMAKRVLISLGTMLADAQERGLVAQNVVRSMRSRRKRDQSGKRQNGKLKVGVDIPSPTDIRAIVEHMEGRWRPILLTAIFTGLRSSELRGLRWADIDMKRGEIHVRQRADRYNVIGEPKSDAGTRTLPLPPIVVSALREWKLRCPKGELGLAFPTGKGNVENHQNILTRGFFPAQIAAKVAVNGVPKYSGLHALRHFYASWCINRKQDGGLELPLKVVQERMGHATVVLTSDLYGHLFPRGDDGSEMAAAEAALLG
jgi:integrase